jgi:hypothetical protein
MIYCLKNFSFFHLPFIKLTRLSIFVVQNLYVKERATKLKPRVVAVMQFALLKKVVHCFGLKWIAMMVVVPLPRSKRPSALPFLTTLAPSKFCDKAENNRHKTTVD